MIWFKKIVSHIDYNQNENGQLIKMKITNGVY